MQSIFNFLRNWLVSIEEIHNVNPMIFAILYLGGVPIFWLSIYKIVRCLKDAQTEKIIKWGLILGAVILAPFGYVAIFGRNLPGAFWMILIAVIVLSVFSVFKKIRQKL
ncbi:MAG: hypothetical protein QME68_07785 [Elusimicrobiota bacterium]|nr:hypothetical protein [Elusimicrobiota bacterium]